MVISVRQLQLLTQEIRNRYMQIVFAGQTVDPAEGCGACATTTGTFRTPGRRTAPGWQAIARAPHLYALYVDVVNDQAKCLTMNTRFRPFSSARCVSV